MLPRLFIIIRLCLISAKTPHSPIMVNGIYTAFLVTKWQEQSSCFEKLGNLLIKVLIWLVVMFLFSLKEGLEFFNRHFLFSLRLSYIQPWTHQWREGKTLVYSNQTVP